jgi:hypothetical protein
MDSSSLQLMTQELLSSLPVLEQARALSPEELRRLQRLLEQGILHAAVLAQQADSGSIDAYRAAMISFAASLQQRSSRLQTRRAELETKIRHLRSLDQWKKGMDDTVSFSARR